MNLNVLVTGAGGLIGRQLLPALLSRGHRVVAAYRQAPAAAIPCHAVIGDLFEASVRAEAFRALRNNNDNECAVVHLAGLANAATARADRTNAFVANAVLTRDMLESTLAAGARRFLLASTGYVYGDGAHEPFRETQPPQPRSVYAATKLAAEAMVHGYAWEGQIAGEILRIANVFGADSPAATVSGRILSQLRRGEPVTVASRQPVRDFIFVADVAAAICAMLESTASAGCRVTNVSTGIGVSVGQFVDTAIAAAGSNAAPVPPATEAGEDSLILSNELIRNRTGWSPRYSLFEGLKCCLSAA